MFYRDESPDCNVDIVFFETGFLVSENTLNTVTQQYLSMLLCKSSVQYSISLTVLYRCFSVIEGRTGLVVSSLRVGSSFGFRRERCSVLI